MHYFIQLIRPTLLLLPFLFFSNAYSQRCDSLFLLDSKILSWDGRLTKLGHKEGIQDLIEGINNPEAMYKVLEENDITPPTIFEVGEGQNNISDIYKLNNYTQQTINEFYHGTTLKNALNIKKNGISFSGGEGGVASGFYSTHIFDRARSWAHNASERKDTVFVDENSQVINDKSNLDNEGREPVVIHFTLKPKAKVIQLGRFLVPGRVVTGPDPESYTWFESMIDSGQGPKILKKVLSKKFIKKYFKENGFLKSEGMFLNTKQGFAHLFGADAMITDAPYGQTRRPELVLLSSDLIDTLTIQKEKIIK